MKNSRNTQFISLNLDAIVSSVMKSLTVSPCCARAGTLSLSRAPSPCRVRAGWSLCSHLGCHIDYTLRERDEDHTELSLQYIVTIVLCYVTIVYFQVLLISNCARFIN